MKHFFYISTIIVALLLSLMSATDAYSADKSRGLWASYNEKANGVFVSWRMRATDAPKSTTYKLYADGNLVSTLTDRTNVTLETKYASSTFSLEVYDKNGNKIDSQEGVKCDSKFYHHIKLDTPANYTLNGTELSYSPNDCSAYDMDGDGEQEIIVGFQGGIGATCAPTAPPVLACYKLDGTKLWEINLGPNVLGGCRFVFLCYDFDGDGKGELIVKTAQGAKDATGNYLSKGAAAGADHTASSVNSSNVITDGGKEWITCFDGVTGRELATIDYWPYFNIQSNWNPSGTKDTNTYGHRGNWFKGCVAFLNVNGKAKPCAVTTRGIYTYSYAAAYTWDGKNLTNLWKHTSDKVGEGIYGKGAHSITCGDVDGDGFDEIIVGGACLDHDGSVLWRAENGHGDVTALGEFRPDNDGMEYFFIKEDGQAYDCAILDAKTGKVLSSAPVTSGDVGRGLILDCDSTYSGSEYMIISYSDMFSSTGETIAPWHVGTTNSSSLNMRIYWDGDLLEEYHDRQHVDKWDNVNHSWGRTITFWNSKVSDRYATTNNSSKNNACLQADLYGDWREEVVYWGADGNGTQYLCIYTSTIESPYKLPWLRDDHTYDMAVAWQNCGYNQTPYLGYSPLEYYRNLNKVPTLTKNGAGSSNQTINKGNAIVDFSYVWENADGVTVTGLPEGVNYTIDYTSKRVSISGTPTAEPGTYKFTVTTTGNEPEATKSGSITIAYTDPAEIIKQGAGSSKQTVYQDSAIVDFKFAWKNATTVTVTGLPNGVTATVDNDAKTVYFTGYAKDNLGKYEYAVTTVGGITDSVRTGYIEIVEYDPTNVQNVASDRTYVAPNPMIESTQLYVDNTNTDVEWAIYSTNGNLLMSGKASGTNAEQGIKIERGSLNAGFYILQVKTADRNETFRLLVK